MNAPVITALATWVPDAVPLSQWYDIEKRLRLIEHPGWNAWMTSWQPDYKRYLETYWNAWNDGPVPGEHGLTGPGMVPVETGTGLSGLAAKVANILCAARAPDAPAVDIVMFCHSSLDEHVSTTTAGRLRAVAGTPCFPFSVSQQQGVSVFTALRLAADLFIAEPEVCTILIVAAEKWCPPFSRWAAPHILQGDAAGALLVERASEAARGLRLIDASTRNVAPLAASQLQSRRAVESAWAPALISMIGEMLMRHGHRLNEVDEVVGHLGSPLLTSAVCKTLGRPDTGLPHQHHAHLGTSESIVRLAQTLSVTALPQQAVILMWGFGLGGYVGGALLEARGAPFVYVREDARCLS
jgi:3-oxoacyl-[acyl-carrier-protein] synthase III